MQCEDQADDPDTKAKALLFGRSIRTKSARLSGLWSKIQQLDQSIINYLLVFANLYSFVEYCCRFLSLVM